ncbi:hypothetical protein CapIbe_007556 [Capra ibex]
MEECSLLDLWLTLRRILNLIYLQKPLFQRRSHFEVRIWTHPLEATTELIAAPFRRRGVTSTQVTHGPCGDPFPLGRASKLGADSCLDNTARSWTLKNGNFFLKMVNWQDRNLDSR